MPKFTIDFGAEYDKRLGEVAQRKGMTKADIVRRAVATYVVTQDEAQRGNRLAITDPDGKVIKELVPG